VPDEREQAVAFLWATDLSAAEAATPVWVSDRHGVDCDARAWVITDRQRPLLWDANYLYVQHRGRADAEALVRAAVRTLGSADGARGGIVIAGASEGAQLDEPFAALGWRAGPLLLMAHRHPQHLAGAPGGRPVDDTEATPARRAVILDGGRGGESVADQILSRAALIARLTEGASYGAEHEGSVASSCVVLRRGSVAQLDDIGTAPAARGRGLGRAVVSVATQRARERAALVFLCADPLDWPRHLYARLGYEPVGYLHRFFPVF